LVDEGKKGGKKEESQERGRGRTREGEYLNFIQKLVNVPHSILMIVRSRDEKGSIKGNREEDCHKGYRYRLGGRGLVGSSSPSSSLSQLPFLLMISSLSVSILPPFSPLFLLFLLFSTLIAAQTTPLKPGSVNFCVRRSFISSSGEGEGREDGGRTEEERRETEGDRKEEEKGDRREKKGKGVEVSLPSPSLLPPTYRR
jgi:hypothetical protein